MGWSFNMDRSQTKAEFVAELNRGFSPGYTMIEHRVVGNHLWQLVAGPNGKKFIALQLMSRGGGKPPHGWGSKGMDESWGPYYFDCPLTLLDAADDTDNESALAWRKKVREHHAAKSAKPKPAAGQIVKYGPHCYKLDRPYAPRKGWWVTRLDGAVFRMNAKQLAQAEVQS